MPGWYGGTCRCCCCCCCSCCVPWAWCTGGVVSVAPSDALRPWTAPSTLGLTLPNWMGALATFVLFPTLHHVDASSAPAARPIPSHVHAAASTHLSIPPPLPPAPSLDMDASRHTSRTPKGGPCAPARLCSCFSSLDVACHTCFGRRLDRSRCDSTCPSAASAGTERTV